MLRARPLLSTCVNATRRNLIRRRPFSTPPSLFSTRSKPTYSIPAAAIATTLTCAATGLALCEAKPETTNTDSTKPVEPVRYSLIALGKEPLAELRKKCRPRFPRTSSEALIIVTRDPSEELVKDWDDLLDEPVELQLLGVVEDDHCQVALLESLHLHVQPSADHSYAVLSQSTKLTAAQISALVDRVIKRREKEGAEWEGDLPGPGSARFRLMKDEDIRIQGTYCVDTKWSKGKCKHERENTCSFCKFMKAGPCRHEFIAWEKCVDIPNSDQEDNDFVDRCASQTLVLKSCVDANPEYYFIVGDTEADEEVVRKAKERKAKEEEEKERAIVKFLASYGA